ncbi:MAG: tetratricopeptide repeat protein [Pyrinomonadaceae bacterium]
MRSYLYACFLTGLVFANSIGAQTAYDHYEKALSLHYNDNVQALVEIDKAISLARENKLVLRELYLPDFYELRARLLFDLGRYKEAGDEYTLTLKTSKPDSLHRRYRARANAFCRSGRYADAISDYTASLAWKGWDSRSRGYILADRAECHLMNGRKDLALPDIELAIATSNRASSAYNLRGKLKMEEGKLESALEDFTNALVADHRIEYERNRSAVWIRLGKTEEAYRNLDLLLKDGLRGRDERLYVHRGELAFLLGRLTRR